MSVCPQEHLQSSVDKLRFPSCQSLLFACPWTLFSFVALYIACLCQCRFEQEHRVKGKSVGISVMSRVCVELVGILEMAEKHTHVQQVEMCML